MIRKGNNSRKETVPQEETIAENKMLQKRKQWQKRQEQEGSKAHIPPAAAIRGYNAFRERQNC